MGWQEFIEQIESACSNNLGGRRLDCPRKAPQWFSWMGCSAPFVKSWTFTPNRSSAAPVENFAG
jgi:hypothetical protein